MEQSEHRNKIETNNNQPTTPKCLKQMFMDKYSLHILLVRGTAEEAKSYNLTVKPLYFYST